MMSTDTTTQRRPADKRLAVVLATQHATPGMQVRPCHYLYAYEHEGETWLFHLLTKEVMSIPTTEWQSLQKEAFTLQDNPSKSAQTLFEHYFLVPQNQDDEQFYLDILELLDVLAPEPEGITGYTILPTTACNARCFYCFELGFAYHPMDDATTEATIRYIMDHKPEKGPIRLSWFGGEPLMGRERIRQICEALTDESVEFTSSMISNGSLFTEEIAQEAVDIWNLKTVQITLDGYEDEYNRRKNYYITSPSPYTLVRNAIDLLIKAGIRVQVRLNCDCDNLEEQKQLMCDLMEEYKGEQLFMVYPTVLYGQGSKEDESKLFCSIHEWLASLNDPRLPGRNPLMEAHLKRNYCMADIHSAVLIGSKGELYDCENITPERIYGSVFNGIEKPDLYKRMKQRQGVHERCKGCRYLPLCTVYTGCPHAFVICKDVYNARLENDAAHAVELLLTQAEHREAQAEQVDVDVKADIEDLRPSC